jgi:molybdopterin-guanine dinucleotide biosynthesis protein A
VKHTAIILAGGKSQRFLQDKTLLKLRENKLLIENIVDKCRPFADEILIVSNHDNKFGISGTVEVRDHYADLGPMGGIHAGLQFMKGDRALVTACDMPFFDTLLAEKLLSLSEDYDVVLPRDGEDLEPLFAVYKKSTTAVFEDLISRGVLRPIKILPKVRVKYLDKEDWVCTEENRNRNVFFNINYQEDYFALTDTRIGE